MRVSVDFGRCESNGLCALAAPTLFTLDEQGYLGFVEQPEDDARAAAQSAVRACPTQAIRIVEDTSVPDSPGGM